MQSLFPADQVSLTVLLLLSLRIGAVLLMTPVFAAADLPVTVRVLLVVGLSVALSGGLQPGAAIAPSVLDHPGALLQAAFTEVALGATMAVAIHVAFAAFVTAGRLLDIQIGFGLSQVFDPASNAALPVLSSAFSRVATVVFFVVDGHHALLRALAFSLDRLPPGGAWSIDAAMLPVLRQVGGLFGLSLSLAAPVVFCLLMTELALGVLARNLPQMNMLTMGIPVKIVVGLVALSLWVGGMAGVMDRVYRGIHVAWDGVLASQPGGR
jgi:flagellar biosynthetic protein FliR